MTLQKKATIISSLTATVLIIIKLTIGLLSGSVAVLASAIDSILDLIVSAFNYFAINKAEKPADEQFNYGRGKVEALAAVIEGTVITMSGIFIFYESIKKAYRGDTISHLTPSLIVMVISLVLTLALVVFLNYVAKKTNSMVIRADALHYKTDIFSNGIILISLIIIQLTNFYLIDSIMGVVISIYIVYSAYEIIKDGIYMLLDVSLDKNIVESIENIIKDEGAVSDYHFLKTRKSGNTNFVDVHLVFNTDISLLDAHRAADRVEDKIQEINKKDEWIMNTHLDPYDDSEFGS
ncbi:MAG: cation transporter [Epsilonproteobacteria bacterium]|nr:cation transporter [Campylobacterota bacterium]